MQFRYLCDRGARYLLFLSALISLFVVFLIGLFTLREAWPAFRQVGWLDLLIGSEWRPGRHQFGLLAMIAGSVWATVGAMTLGVPLALASAIFLAEVAPPWTRGIVRSAVQLLAGIPSVVYGLFGMVVLVPLIRQIPVAGNTGFGLLAASMVLAVMILPTITSIAADAIRAVPREYREGSLALGCTHWQT
ncbi:MAG TPA: ABC transporter permease subunit, partial [Chloroflexi bacterium]|nr:ABC transporter permease subunit [Chloroflexota bacterium]